MTVCLARVIVGLILMLNGVFWWQPPDFLRPKVLGWPRSKWWGLATFGLGSAWFLYLVTQLGVSDFGEYRHLFFSGFGALFLGTAIFVRDFLAVRGLSLLFLLVARLLLDVLYASHTPLRLSLVVFVYSGIVSSLYWSLFPYRLRDGVEWIVCNRRRPKILAILSFAYGLVLVVGAPWG
jgi:hypothetical protein